MRLLLPLILAFGLSAPVIAQESESDIEHERDRFLRPDHQLGTRFKQEPEAASQSDARQMQKRLAKCIYYGEREELDTLLANSDFDIIDFEATAFDPESFFDDINFSRCLGRAMKGSQYKIYARMRYSTLRNLLAEEAYLFSNKDVPNREEGAPKLISERFANQTRNPRTEALAEVADCISYRNASGAHELLDSTPGTSKERDALEVLYPTVLTCLEAENDPELGTSIIRQLVADGLWARSYYGGFDAAPTEPAEAAE